MRKIMLLLILSSIALAWGRIGHYTVGQIAEDHLSRKAKKGVTAILGHHDLAAVSNWPDDIKSDDAWDHAYTWHWVTIPAGESYDPAVSDGKAAVKIEEFIQVLTASTASLEDQAVALKFLVHLVADIHQPLHVGNGTDRGGNDLDVTWFGRNTNLHRVWDSQLIESQQMSYQEWARMLQRTYPENLQADLMEFGSLESILAESQTFHESIYSIGDGDLGYRYIYDHRQELDQRLLAAGLRLAAILNAIYD